MRPLTRLFFAFALSLPAFCVHAESGPSYDIVIRNGHIIDGTGSPWYSADIAIKDGRIAVLGRIDPCRCKADHRRARQATMDIDL